MRLKTVGLLLLACILCGPPRPLFANRADGPVEFGRDVLPILSNTCFGCHGPDESARKGRLRLDVREGAIAARSSGPAIVPGDPRRSAVAHRLRTQDPDEVMPPPDSNKPRLQEAQIRLIEQWIQEGAVWGKHWAFEKPRRVEFDSAIGHPNPHPVDVLVRRRLKQEGLDLSPAASKETLVRRLSLDLTGLPPSAFERDAFLSDPSHGAYERLADRLLASVHFGERMAMWWLDAARYSDTDGFQQDATRTNWPWRDWVVDAFNRNMPFDRFTIEQFAGDLLPGGGPEQKLATCFHRNHMTNGEGGRDPEESRIDYVHDRIHTLGAVWLGLTLNCSQCHSHKFDPISQAEYYQLFAFFNSIDEDGKAGRAAKPYLPYVSERAGRALVEAQDLLDQRRRAENAAREAALKPFEHWLTRQWDRARTGPPVWVPLMASETRAVEGTELRQAENGIIRAAGPMPRQDDYQVIGPVPLPRVTGLRLEVFPDASHQNGAFSRGGNGEFILTDIKVQVRERGKAQLRDIRVQGAAASYSADKAKNNNYGSVIDLLDDDPRNGWTTAGAGQLTNQIAVFELGERLVLNADEEIIFEMRHRSTGDHANIGLFRVSLTDQAGEAARRPDRAPLEELGKPNLARLTELQPELRARLFEQFLEDDAGFAAARAALAQAKRQWDDATAASGKLEVMVLAERPEPRQTQVLVRGVWDNKGERVERGVPTAIAPWPEGEAKTRLGLARWIVSADNPLTARVIVNHLWRLLFGAGLARTVEDFGTQGERPVHQELLDFLAVEFVQSGWDVKHILRLMVTSETYRQRSAMTPELAARDPENQWLARGARFRLPSWMLRDAALKTSGLLNDSVGGPPVFPWQPEGVWEEIFMGRFNYFPSQGRAQYRRTLYAFWRRAVAPAFLFDSAQRRVCEVRTPTTNTPLQALTLLNDLTYLEAARALAEQCWRAGAGLDARLQSLAIRALGREASAAERDHLRGAFEEALKHYELNPKDAETLLSLGQGLRFAEENLPAQEIAALTVVANLALNLDEALTHE